MPPFPPFPATGLVDGDLAVRVWAPATDAEDGLRLVHDPEQDRWATPFFVPRPVNLAAYRHRLEREVARAAGGEPASYAVASADTGQLLGDISWRLDNPRLGVADVGYGTLPEARGRGVASGALRLLSAWLLAADGPALARVQLEHAVGNPASCGVARRAGFEQEGIRRRFLPLVDPTAPAGWTRADICLHGLVADELR